MLLIIIVMIVIGIYLGYEIIPPTFIGELDLISTLSLSFLLLGVGIDIGKNKKIINDLKRLGLKVLLVPILVGVGSIAGAILFGKLLDIPVNEASAIGAGFGWYSLSGIILSKIYSADIGTLAFLTNVFREVIAIILIPIMAKLGSKIAIIAPGGATTMDTTLPLITRSINQAEITIVAFISGVILSAMVPVLVPLLINI
ncbi:lysine exporter LysO family protein [Orenia marismortui]|uniref:Lysine exporter LysO-like protein n=1 Tax=Orenia marismortui TaxID=46469 RepID=A0A4R8H119_9FIRM|nr:lysine exporter LysO family protein [Orenia marismortui]TDX53024.1 lysine exporter LysO-like protein [Orenia marismortui]